VKGGIEEVRLRLSLGVALPAVLIGAALLPFWLLHRRLPELLANVWNFRGEPTDRAPLELHLLLFTAFLLVPVIAMFMLSFRRPAVRGEICGPLGRLAFVALGMVGINWLIVLANLDAASWKQAAPPNLPFLLAWIAISAAFAAMVARSSRPLEAVASSTNAGNLPSAGLSPGDRAMWVGYSRAQGIVPSALIFGGLSLLSLFGSASPVFLIVMVRLLFFSCVRVTVDRRGVRIAHGLLGRPMQRLRLDQIRQATSVQLKPSAFADWLYPFSLKLFRNAAIVPRSGPGVRLELEAERILDIAIDDADEAAGVINDLIRGGHFHPSAAPAF
jgi:hypothetical protein